MPFFLSRYTHLHMHKQIIKFKTLVINGKKNQEDYYETVNFGTREMEKRWL